MVAAAADDTVDAAAPRSRKGAQTRARLLEAARLVFEEDGFLDARITDIAERANLSHGSFYHYFESKEQIFREVVEAQGQYLTELGDPSEPRSPDETLRDRILRANRAYLDRFREAARLMGVIEQMSRYDDHVRDHRTRQQRQFADRYGAVVRRLQEEGVVDRALDPEITAIALAGMVTRFAELWLVQGYADYDPDVAADQLTRLWANALGLPEDPAPTRARRAR